MARNDDNVIHDFRERARELYSRGYSAEELRKLIRKSAVLESEEERARWMRVREHKKKMDAFSEGFANYLRR